VISLVRRGVHDCILIDGSRLNGTNLMRMRALTCLLVALLGPMAGLGCGDSVNRSMHWARPPSQRARERGASVRRASWRSSGRISII
jgi:hypothetical protein